MTDNIEQRAVALRPTPCAYTRVCDGGRVFSIGAEQPPDRAGGYATPWAAMYDTPAVLAAIDAILRERDDAHAALKNILDAAGNPVVVCAAGQGALDATVSAITAALREQHSAHEVDDPVAWMTPGTHYLLSAIGKNAGASPAPGVEASEASIPPFARSQPASATSGADRRDAERYRWLRDCDSEQEDAVMIRGEKGRHTDELCRGVILDGAIDAAIAAQRKGGE